MTTQKRSKTAILAMSVEDFLRIPEVRSIMNVFIRTKLSAAIGEKKLKEIVKEGEVSLLRIPGIGNKVLEQFNHALALHDITMRRKTARTRQNDQAPDETIIKLSPLGLTVTFGSKVDAANIIAFQKDFAALAAKHLTPSDASNAAPAPPPP